MFALASFVLPDMLLFCVESAAGSHVAYFVELSTLKDEVPELRRFSCSHKLLNTLMLGGLYTLKVSGRRLVTATLTAEYDIDESYFTLLLELKSILYRRGEGLSAFDPTAYYSFSELRSLMEYREPFSRRAGNFLIRALAYAPAFLLPPVLYVLLLSALLKSSASPAAPLLLVLALPMMVFCMAALYRLGETGLLRLERTRYGMLRAYTLRHGGQRLSLKMSEDVKKRLLCFGGVSAAALLLGVALMCLL